MINTRTIDLKEFKTWCDSFIASSYKDIIGKPGEKKKAVMNFILLKATNLQSESTNKLDLDELLGIGEMCLEEYLSGY